MPNVLLGALNNSGEGSGESEVESELDTPRTQLTSGSESSETTETHRNMFKPLDTIYKASLHLRRAMVHTSPHLIQKHLFFSLYISDSIVLEYLCRFWPIVGDFGHLFSGCVRSCGISLASLHFWWSVARALKIPAHWRWISSTQCSHPC